MNDLWLVEQVANQLNVTHGADYRAVLVEERDNIADALLVSKSERWPKRYIQITTIPRDLQHREVSVNRSRLERELAKAIASHESDCVISVGLKRMEIALVSPVRTSTLLLL